MSPGQSVGRRSCGSPHPSLTRSAYCVAFLGLKFCKRCVRCGAPGSGAAVGLDGKGGQCLEDSNETFEGNAAGPEHGDADQSEAPDVRVISGLHGGIPDGCGELMPEP